MKNSSSISPSRQQQHQSCPALIRSAKDGQWHLKQNHILDATKLSPRKGGELRDVPHSRPPYLGPDPHRSLLSQQQQQGKTTSLASSSLSPKKTESQEKDKKKNKNAIASSITTAAYLRSYDDDESHHEKIKRETSSSSHLLSEDSPNKKNSNNRKLSQPHHSLERVYESIVSVATVTNDPEKPNFGRRTLPKSMAKEREEMRQQRSGSSKNKNTMSSPISVSPKHGRRATNIHHAPTSPQNNKKISPQQHPRPTSSSSSASSNDNNNSSSSSSSPNNNNDEFKQRKRRAKKRQQLLQTMKRSDLEKDSLSPGIPLDSKSTEKCIDQFEDRLLRMDLRTTDELEGNSRTDTPITMALNAAAAAQQQQQQHGAAPSSTSATVSGSPQQMFMSLNGTINNNHNNKNAGPNLTATNLANQKNPSTTNSSLAQASFLGVANHPHAPNKNLTRRTTFFENIKKAKNRNDNSGNLSNLMMNFGDGNQSNTSGTQHPPPELLQATPMISVGDFVSSAAEAIKLSLDGNQATGNNNNTSESIFLGTPPIESPLMMTSNKMSQFATVAAAAGSSNSKQSSPASNSISLSIPTDAPANATAPTTTSNQQQQLKSPQQQQLFNPPSASHNLLLSQLHEFNNNTHNGAPRPWETMDPTLRGQNPFFGILSGQPPHKLRPAFLQIEQEYPNIRQKGIHSRAFLKFLQILAPCPDTRSSISETLVQKAMSYFECNFYIENNPSLQDSAPVITTSLENNNNNASSGPVVKRSVSFPQIVIRYGADFSPRYTDSAVMAVFARIAEQPSIHRLRPNSAILLSELRSEPIRQWATKNLTSNSAPRHRWLAVCDALDDPCDGLIRKEMDDLIRDVVPMPPDMNRSDFENKIFGDRQANGAPLPPPPVLTLDQWRYVVYGSQYLLPLVIALRNDVEHPDEKPKQFEGGLY